MDAAAVDFLAALASGSGVSSGLAVPSSNASAVWNGTAVLPESAPDIESRKFRNAMAGDVIAFAAGDTLTAAIGCAGAVTTAAVGGISDIARRVEPSCATAEAAGA